MAEQMAEGGTGASVYDDCLMVTVLQKGSVLSYTIPSFPVYSADLRHVKLQYEENNGSVEVIDSFMQECGLLEHTLPAMARVEYDNDHAFLIDVEEFNKSVDISGFKLRAHEGGSKLQVFVIWKWTWLGETVEVGDSDEAEDTQDPITIDTSNEELDDKLLEPEPEVITHKVVFKCIGATKEKRYQQTLSMASKIMKQGTKVQVKLQKEPDNPYDSRAIAFICNINSQWVRIGYIVKEALDAVHSALDSAEIIDIEFDWVKYVVHFKDPGWYAGISITKRGNWPIHVLRCHASRF